MKCCINITQHSLLWLLCSGIIVMFSCWKAFVCLKLTWQLSIFWLDYYAIMIIIMVMVVCNTLLIAVYWERRDAFWSIFKCFYWSLSEKYVNPPNSSIDHCCSELLQTTSPKYCTTIIAIMSHPSSSSHSFFYVPSSEQSAVLQQSAAWWIVSWLCITLYMQHLVHWFGCFELSKKLPENFAKPSNILSLTKSGNLFQYFSLWCV